MINKINVVNMLNKEIDYSKWIFDIEQSNFKYCDMFENKFAFPPIFFFGEPNAAIAATIGVNPSAKEFAASRKWNFFANEKYLINRCQQYFVNQHVLPHPWFKVWENFLQNIGLSYRRPLQAVHLDLSPRATRSMGTIQRESKGLQDLFLELIKNDFRYLLKQLKTYKNIQYLFAAGSVTKKFYLIELLNRLSDTYSFSLIPILPFQRGGSGKIGLYELDLGDGQLRHLFFCSTSPSARGKNNPLPDKALWLQKEHPEFLPENVCKSSN